ncbi:unnamed protein product [Spodoptera littoralis]|uniref:Uncharacterized protein n=1 Tax=Spodoptera littoralis TaxID=7109 RepID=A0A9P0I9Z6_SPOLI|nr:unnamed protein product [Spodoptera littoralis]CAH1642865.1 unnamed protein product [Spodoptera littoralis]
MSLMMYIIFAVLAFLAVASAKLIGDLEAGLSEIGAGLGADFGKIGAELGAGVEGIEAGLVLGGHDYFLILYYFDLQIIFAVLAFLAVASAKPFLDDLGVGLGELGAGLGAGLGNIGAGLGAGVEGIGAGLGLGGHGGGIGGLGGIAGLGGRGGRY